MTEADGVESEANTFRDVREKSARVHFLLFGQDRRRWIRYKNWEDLFTDGVRQTGGLIDGELPYHWKGSQNISRDPFETSRSVHNTRSSWDWAAKSAPLYR